MLLREACLQTILLLNHLSNPTAPALYSYISSTLKATTDFLYQCDNKTVRIFQSSSGIVQTLLSHLFLLSDITKNKFLQFRNLK